MILYLEIKKKPSFLLPPGTKCCLSHPAFHISVMRAHSGQATCSQNPLQLLLWSLSFLPPPSRLLPAHLICHARRLQSKPMLIFLTRRSIFHPVFTFMHLSLYFIFACFYQKSARQPSFGWPSVNHWYFILFHHNSTLAHLKSMFFAGRKHQ